MTAIERNWNGFPSAK